MPSLVSLFGPLRGVAAAFFKHDIALRRGERGIEIVLEQRTPARPLPAEPPVDAAARARQQELDLMRSQLTALLDDVAGTRAAMRHLVFVEHALARKGLDALDKVPLDVLEHALDQFEGLVINWSPVGLAALRSKMAVAVIDRTRADPDGRTQARGASDLLETGPLAGPPPQPVVVEPTDDEALAAAYAALGGLVPEPASS